MMNAVINPAVAVPKHQVPRLMLRIRPRRCAGQVSATSSDPSAHSPFSANDTRMRAMMNVVKVGDSATIGIISENIAMLMASRVRRPNLSAIHGQK